MKRALPPYCYQKPRGVYFQRRGWDSHKFQGAPHTPEFAAEYALILRGAPPVAPGGRSFTALVRSYQRSDKWKRLAPRTKADYDKVLAWVEAKLGPLPVEKMQRKDVIRARDANAKTVRFANYIVQVLRILFEYSIDIGWRRDNPAKEVGGLKSAGPERQPWTADLIAAYRAAAPMGTRQRLIFEVCLGTGQRIGDALRMRWDDLHNGGVNVRQNKTGVKLWIPITSDLRAALDATKRVGLTICAQPNGKPTSYRGAADLVFSVREKIGAKAYDNHALRYTAAAELAAVGCTDEQIAAITGHKSLAMIRKYAGTARQISRATEAMKRREE